MFAHAPVRRLTVVASLALAVAGWLTPAAARSAAGGPSAQLIVFPRAGDFNNDGLVDGADLAIIHANFGLAGGATTAHGDADKNGSVDGADLLAWQGFVNAAAAPVNPAGNVVPEPTSWSLTLVAFALTAAALRLQQQPQLKLRPAYAPAKVRR